ncbi:MAG TPA: glycosyltransferase family 4 protein [Gaiellaceae bacterium]|nr:glycosyltransferase family 4 protein [Gaiellaceae bacterium]
MKVVVLTTSYPRDENDFAGRFVAETVSRLRARGVEIVVVGPGAYRDFGLAYGPGVVPNLRRRPWAAPLLLGSMTRAVRRAAARADLVHAYWLPAGGPAALSGRPFVVSLPGTDMELAARVPWLARPMLRRARVALAVSQAIAAQASALGARDVRVVPPGIEIPPDSGDEADPPEILFVGRLAPEKGIHELMQAADGLNLVVVGDGPLRALVPNGVGYVSRAEVLDRYRRAAVVVCPSRRDGFPLACAEAMAHGRAVVATAVGGLPDMVVDGETGLLVPPRDPRALRAAIDRLLADPELRRRLGAAAKEWISEICSWERVIDATISSYEAAVAA